MDGSRHAEIYPGPRPFSSQEKDLFFGRDREQSDIANLLLSYPLVLLYAQSGAGKTSLVCAGLIPRLGEGDWTLARVSGDLPDVNHSAMNVFTYNVLLSGLETVGPHVQLATAFSRTTDRPWFLILDQFEELFNAHAERWRDREPFLRELAQLIRKDPNARVLLVLREEWCAHLDRFSDLFPDGMRIRYRLEQLREDAARKAIVGPAVKSGSEAFSASMSELADILVKNLQRVPMRTSSAEIREVEGEFVEPVHLQVVCRNLWNRIAQDQNPLTETEITALMEVDRVLESFYDAALKRVVGRRPLQERQLRLWFQNKLITAAGTRGIVFMNESDGLTAGVPNSRVEGLERERVLRRDIRGGASWFEITHDRLIGPIQRANKTWRHQRRVRLAAWTIPPLVVASTLAIKIAVDRQAELRSRAEEQLQLQAQLQQQLRTETSRADTATDRANAAVQLAATAADPTETPERKARALAVLAVEQAVGGDAKAGASLLRDALKLSPLAARQALDERMNSSADSGSMRLQDAYKELVETLGDDLAGPGGSPPGSKVLLLSVPPETRQYICDHDYYVIGASEKVEDAQQEVNRRWRSLYPHAMVGLPQVELRQAPIVFDYFLTCDQARQLAADVQAKYKSGPLIKPWHTALRCEACTASIP